MKPHKHAELIKAWADGATIQYYEVSLGWIDTDPLWGSNHKYRIKPAEKVVRWQWIIKNEHTTFFTLTIAFFTEREARAEFSNSIVGKAEWSRMEFDE